MTACSFCGKPIERGTGKIFVKTDGSILFFCTGKCEKNARIRDKKKVGWTKEYEKLKKRRLGTITKTEKK